MTLSDALDSGLAVGLILGLPLVFTLRPTKPRSALARYLSTIAVAGLLLLWLGADWRAAGRSLDLLGLAWPPRGPGRVGLVIAAILIPVLLLAASRSRPPSDEAALDRVRALLPQSRLDGAALIVFVVIGLGGWEVLYRGFLIWWLGPRIGPAGAVGVAALAYAGAHGFKDLKTLFASFLAALAFTLAYVATNSLWWLILLHGALPFAGILNARRVPEKTPATAP